MPAQEYNINVTADDGDVDAMRSLIDRFRPVAVAEAAASAAQAALYDGPKVDTFAELADVTPDMLAVGEYIRCISGGWVYKRVDDGSTDPGLLDYTEAGGVKLNALGAQAGGIPAAALNNDVQGALNAASDTVYIPEGIFTEDSVMIDKSLTIIGQGRTKSKLQITGSTVYDGVKAGIICKGADGEGLASLIQMRGLDIEFTGAETGVSGALITRKQYWDDVYIHGFTDHGMILRPLNVNTEAPYFCRFTSVWSKFNGGSGLRLVDSCNANQFTNCLFDSNGEHGVHQVLIGLSGINQAVYSNDFIGGQASYNQKHGLYFQNGANNRILGTYMEYNSQVDGGNPKTGAYKNLQLGSTVSRMFAVLGEQGTDTDLDQVVGLNTVANNYVSIGGTVLTPLDGLALGYENTGDGRSMEFHGRGGAVHNISFYEAFVPNFHIRYDGTGTNPTNELQFVPADGGVEGTPPIRMRNNGQMGFFGATPVSRPSVAAAATDPATTQALVNDLRDKLITLGIIS